MPLCPSWLINFSFIYQYVLFIYLFLSFLLSSIKYSLFLPFTLLKLFFSFISLPRLGKNRAGSRLKYVDFSGCAGISDGTIRQLAKAVSEPSHQDSTRSQGGVSSASPVDKNGRPKMRCGGHQDANVARSCHAVSGTRLDSSTPNNDIRTNLGHCCSANLDPCNHHHHHPTSTTDRCHGDDDNATTTTTQRAVQHSCHSNCDRSSITGADGHVQQQPNRTEVAHGDQMGLSSTTMEDDALRTSRHGDSSATTSSWYQVTKEEEGATTTASSSSGQRINNVAVERSLEFLSLSGCYKITDRGLR